MSDRTWNHIDARLYEEDLSNEAIIIFACILARCPNQYGIFDSPMGFLTKFFHDFFARQQVELVLTELEGAGFLKFYRDRKVIWIVKKWKRIGMPTGNHKKGLENILERYPEVREDIYNLYDPLFNLIQSPSHDHDIPMQSPSNDHRIPDTDSDTDTDKRLKDNTCPAKNAGRAKKAKKNKPREKKTPARLYLEFYKIEFKDRKGTEPVLSQGDCINAQKRYTATVKIHSDKIIKGVTKYYLSLKDDVWKGHKPHLLFKNFDRLLEGMMEHQAKFEKRKDQGDRISSAQTAWLAEQKQAEIDGTDEVPDKYKLPEKYDEN